MDKQEIIELNEKAIAIIGLPKGSGKFGIVKDTFRWKLNPLKFWWDQVKLPEGEWEILGLEDKLTEEQWKGIVSWMELAGQTGYMDYSYDDLRFPFPTATESGLSLLKSKSLEDKSIIILIKQ